VIWDDNKVVATDFETSGTLEEYALQPWRLSSGDFWATSLSIIRFQEGRLVPDGSTLSPTAADMRAFLERAIDNDWVVVGWNLLFDISVFMAYGLTDLCHKVKWLDGMLLWRHFEIEPEYETASYRKKSYKLKPNAIERFIKQMLGYEEDVDFHSTDPAELAKLQKYNDRDSVSAWAITKMIWDKLTEKQRRAALIEAECLSMVAAANLHGLPVDTLATNELSAKLEQDAKDALAKLVEHGVTEKIVRSPKQLSALLFDQWGLPVYKETVGKKNGVVNRSTDKEVLHELAFMDARCADLRAYREALNNRTKFAATPLVSADYNGDGRSRPSAIVFGTYSGRLTYSSSQGKKGTKAERQTGFALHQEKRGEEFRSIIIPPPGYTLVEFDAAGQEFRWMAILSSDPAMMQICVPGEDMHAYMGARIVGKDYRFLQTAAKIKGSREEQDRYLGKVANLSLQYRTFPKTFRKVARVQYNIPMELPEAQRIHRTYQNTYTQVPRYWERQIEKTKQLGYVETLAGRRVSVVGDWGGKLSWQMESTSLNYPVQGTGADQKYLALQLLKPYLLSIGAYFAWDLHDGIYLWVPDDKVAQVAAEGRAILDNLPYREAWGFTPPIPLPWDCKTGKSWGALKEWSDG
jgi:DNA polymerase I-like protein with 3'-5' exonuclease and polymerase domains